MLSLLIFDKKLSNDINHQKVRDYCHYTGKYRGPSHRICNLIFNLTNKIAVGFCNGSKYDYDFIKELGNEFEGQFECIVENSEIYFPIKNQTI